MRRYRLASLLLLSFAGCGRGVATILGGGTCDGYLAQSVTPYVLPYASGTAREIGQGNCSTGSHYGNGRYSYDFTMPIGSSITAVRAGTVTQLLESNVDGNGCGVGRHNFVGVLHSDGTYAEYIHLTLNGVLVDVGQVVTQGQAIALSGNTGCSTAPHLHFQVWSKEGTGAETIPTTFSNTSPHPAGLQAGRSYTAQ